MFAIKKRALTAYVTIGTTWVRFTQASVGGEECFVNADGSNSILHGIDIRNATFRTSGDIVNVASQLGHRVNMAAVPSVGLKNHEWKGTYTYAEIADKFGISAARQAALVASYGPDAVEKAA